MLRSFSKYTHIWWIFYNLSNYKVCIATVIGSWIILLNPFVDEAGVEPAQEVLQTAALPLELSVHTIAETEWFEHSTLCLTSNRSTIELCFHNRVINRKETVHSALTWLSYPKVLGKGFEPSTPESRSNSFLRHLFVGPVRVELTTQRLRISYSANWATNQCCCDQWNWPITFILWGWCAALTPDHNFYRKNNRVINRKEFRLIRLLLYHWVIPMIIRSRIRTCDTRSNSLLRHLLQFAWGSNSLHRIDNPGCCHYTNKPRKRLQTNSVDFNFTDWSNTV